MPIVGIIVGLVLAAWISVFTLFNDTVIRQPLMTGNLMPTSVYGPVVILAMLACGWSLGRLRRRQLVTRRDLVAVVVIATAACAWPGTNFLRTFVGSTGNVANLARTESHWRNTQVLSYVPGHGQDQPRGSGVLLGDGRDVPDVTDVLTVGSATPDDYALDNVPWKAWWPVLRLWGGVALCLGLASVCLGLIVHPQWARYERLPYPLVRFVDELSRPREGSASQRPALLTNKLFWLGLGGVAGIHLLNGLYAWEVRIVQIPLVFNFSPMQQLFPNASRVFGSTEQFFPALYFSVIAFVFFIRGDVSFSVGISNLVWLMLGAAFLARGQTLGNNPIETDAGTLLRAGSYLGFAAMILYLGRRYYLATLGGALWLRRVEPDSRASVWAMRVLALTLGLSVWLLTRYAGLDWRLGLIVIGLIVVMLLILARLSAETGMFYLEPNWMPLAVVTAALGFEGLGPTGFVTVALISTIIVGAPREPLTGYVVNALALSEKLGHKRRLGGVGLGMAGIATVTLGLAIVATLVLVYTRGLSPHDGWANRAHPALPFDALARRLSDLAALGRLDEVIAAANAGHFSAAVPEPAALGWLALGVALVVGCTFARLRLAWWPIHPVLFLVLGSSPAIRVGWSFLIGWALRQAVIRLGGVKAFHAALPLAVGAIAGELLAAVGWQACGVLYYLATGLIPSSYYILPN